MSKSFWAILGVIVIVFGGILFLNGHKANAPSANGAQPTNHVEGLGKDGVTLVEYGDYECPFCAAYYPVVKQLQQQFNDQIYFQFRNLPLIQVHQNALAAARAAEAASLQGKFWQMHDMLYENQTVWAQSPAAETYFNQYATTLNLNLIQFKQDYASSKVNDTINADVNAFLKTGQEESTPTFFLDGKKVQPAFDTTKSVDQNVANFAKLITGEITAKTKR